MRSVFRILNGYEMKISEYETFRAAMADHSKRIELLDSFTLDTCRNIGSIIEVNLSIVLGILTSPVESLLTL